MRSITPIGADFLTVHAQGDCIRAAVEGRGDDETLKILGVTVLTSLSAADLAKEGYDGDVESLVLKRAEAALDAGADGLVASAHEAGAIRARFGEGFFIVTPGIRPKGAAADDQKRIMTPADALAAGATHLVVGRPISAAPAPKAAAEAVAAEIEAARP